MLGDGVQESSVYIALVGGFDATCSWLICQHAVASVIGICNGWARNCVPRMLILSCHVSTCVSQCRRFVGVVYVQPVMFHRALFCIVCKVL